LSVAQILIYQFLSVFVFCLEFFLMFYHHTLICAFRLIELMFKLYW